MTKAECNNCNTRLKPSKELCKDCLIFNYADNGKVKIYKKRILSYPDGHVDRDKMIAILAEMGVFV